MLIELLDAAFHQSNGYTQPSGRGRIVMRPSLVYILGNRMNFALARTFVQGRTVHTTFALGTLLALRNAGGGTFHAVMLFDRTERKHRDVID